jgi:hypothetical protein
MDNEWITMGLDGNYNLATVIQARFDLEGIPTARKYGVYCTISGGTRRSRL